MVVVLTTEEIRCVVFGLFGDLVGPLSHLYLSYYCKFFGCAVLFNSVSYRYRWRVANLHVVLLLHLARQANCNKYFHWLIMKMRKTNDRQHFRSQRHSDDPRRSFSRPALAIMSANVEGLSSSKELLFANICKYHHCEVLCLQETHRGTTHKRPKIYGMTPAIERPHTKH